MDLNAAVARCLRSFFVVFSKAARAIHPSGFHMSRGLAASPAQSSAHRAAPVASSWPACDRSAAGRRRHTRPCSSSGNDTSWVDSSRAPSSTSANAILMMALGFLGALPAHAQNRCRWHRSPRRASTLEVRLALALRACALTRTAAGRHRIRPLRSSLLDFQHGYSVGDDPGARLAHLVGRKHLQGSGHDEPPGVDCNRDQRDIGHHGNTLPA